MNTNIREIKEKVKHELDTPRYEHTLGVMYTAASLAMCHGADMEQALIAGLLHDCAKCIPEKQKIELCEKYKLDITAVERANPSLLHAKLGAFLAKKEYHITEPEILQAIQSHTTGRPAMSLLEKIVYIADYMEPGRKTLANMEEVRRLAFGNIDECLYVILKDSLIYLKKKALPVDPMTEKTYEYYKKELRKE